MKRSIILILIAASIAHLSHAGLYKCSINGQVIYQDYPCTNGKQTEVKPAAKVNPDDARAAAIRLNKDRLWIKRQADEERIAKQRAQLEAASNNINRTIQNIKDRSEQRSANLKDSNCKFMEAATIRAENRALSSRSYPDSQTAQGMRRQYMTLCQ